MDGAVRRAMMEDIERRAMLEDIERRAIRDGERRQRRRDMELKRAMRDAERERKRRRDLELKRAVQKDYMERHRAVPDSDVASVALRLLTGDTKRWLQSKGKHDDVQTLLRDMDAFLPSDGNERRFNARAASRYCSRAGSIADPEERSAYITDMVVLDAKHAHLYEPLTQPRAVYAVAQRKARAYLEPKSWRRYLRPTALLKAVESWLKFNVAVSCLRILTAVAGLTFDRPPSQNPYLDTLAATVNDHLLSVESALAVLNFPLSHGGSAPACFVFSVLLMFIIGVRRAVDKPKPAYVEAVHSVYRARGVVADVRVAMNKIDGAAATAVKSDVPSRVDGVHAALAHLDEEWLHYLNDAEAFFLTKPALRNTAVAQTRAYLDALYALREACMSLTHDSRGDTVIEAEELAEKAMTAWGAADDNALQVGTSDLSPVERDALRRIKSLVAQLEDPSTPTSMRATVMDAITRHMRLLTTVPVSWKDLNLRKILRGNILEQIEA